jgi:hypothetical protein
MTDTRPVGTIPYTNSTLEVLLLPRRSRAVTQRIITVDATVPVEGQTASLLSDADGTIIKAGTSLSFIDTGNPQERQQLLIIEDVTLTTSPTVVSVSPAFRAIAADSTAGFVEGLSPLFGIQTYDLTRTDTTSDVTNLQSGTGTEAAKVRQGRMFQVSGVEIEGDFALNQIIKYAANLPSYINREIHAVLTRPNGERFAGTALTMNYTEPANQNEVMRYSFQLQYQGDPVWTPAYQFS